jgi:hypothetical protein
MLVRLQVGRNAGQIEDIVAHAAEALLASGQAEKLSDAETEAYEDQVERERRGEDDDELPANVPQAFVRRIESDGAGRIISDRQELAFTAATVPVEPEQTVTMLLNELRDVYGAEDHEAALRQVIGYANEANGKPDHSGLRVVALTETAIASLERLKNVYDTDDEADLVETALAGLEVDSAARPPVDETGITVDIPANWRELHHSKRRSLAQQITHETPADTEEADEVIQAHLDAKDA